MQSLNKNSLPTLKIFTVERNVYIIDVPTRTIIKQGYQSEKLPLITNRQLSLVEKKPQKWIKKKQSLAQQIESILNYKSPSYSMKVLTKKVKTVSFI